MRLRTAFALSAALACAACGLFLDDMFKGADASEDTGTDTDSESSTDVTLTPCEGVDLSIDFCCNLEDSCTYADDLFCDCPTCPWDASDCGVGDGGVPDAGTDTEKSG